MAKTKKKDSTDVSEAVSHWLGEISASRKREKDFRKDGEEIIAIYSGERCDAIPFNILFSNVETLLPALFSQTPRPVVQRRFKDHDPVGRAAATAAQRMLEFLCDTNVDGYETFEQSVRHATLDGLLPGRGVTAIKYDAEILESEEADSENAPAPVIKWEQVCTESKQWNRVYLGYAKKWSKVPWIAYEEYLDEDEAERLFGKEISKKIKFTTGEEGDDEEDGTGGKDDDIDTGERKTALVYQIWDKSGGRVVRYISPAYKEDYLLIQDDPLKLTGFFNCPKPIQFIEKSSDLTPTAMYKLYENQAKELNNITRRIKAVVSAIKVRGVYDGALGSEIEQVLQEEENALIPTDKGGSIAAEGGLEKAIWFMPLEKLITVLQQLIIAREQCKRVIYEITGVSDIVRGQSVASETLGAQKIKEAWGTMRLKRLQKSVMTYARDILRIMLEIAASKMSEQTWARATGLPFATTDMRQQAELVMQAAQAQGMQPDPQTMQMLQSPAWGGILKILRDDVQRAYKIDIETNSTIDVEATEDQKNIGDFMNAMGQMLAGLTPMVEKGAMPFEAAKAMILAVVRRFRFGTEVEDELKMMSAPQPKDDGKAAADQAKLQADQAKMAADVQINQSNNQKALQMENIAAQEREADAQRKQQYDIEKMKADVMQKEIEQKEETARENARLVFEERMRRAEASIKRDTEINRAKIAAAAQIEVARISVAAKSAVAID